MPGAYYENLKAVLILRSMEKIEGESGERGDGTVQPPVLESS